MSYYKLNLALVKGETANINLKKKQGVQGFTSFTIKSHVITRDILFLGSRLGEEETSQEAQRVLGQPGATRRIEVFSGKIQSFAEKKKKEHESWTFSV